MNAEELLVHDSRKGKAAERLDASFINSFRILVSTLKFECEIIGQMSTLMVTPQKPQSLRIMDLEGPEVQDAFDTKVPSINIVTQEQVACVRRVASNLEKLHQIVVLAMHITTDRDRSIHLEQIGLSVEDLSTLLDDP